MEALKGSLEFQFPDRNSVDLDPRPHLGPALEAESFNSLIGILWI